MLHLLKLSVGPQSIADLEARIAARLELAKAAKLVPEQIHTTRMVPKRGADLLEGGSIYWVIKGQLCARQRLLELRPFTDGEGIGRCDIVIEPVVIPVLPRPCRPFQGWRYLEPQQAPADLGEGLAGMEAAQMPEHLRHALRELCLI